MAVLTGVWLEEEHLGAACLDASAGAPEFYLNERVEGQYHGTGDLFASALLGGLLNGAALGAACGNAVEFTLRCIRTTRERSRDFRFGPKFETHLPWLGQKMEGFRCSSQKPVANEGILG